VAPLIQDIIRISGLREADDAGRSVDLGVDRLGGDELADVLLRLILGQVEKLRETLHLDARVVLGHHADVVLNDTFPQVLPPLVSLLIG